jgi:hypothetical protein
MRYFVLLNFQHVMAYVFVGLLFMVVFGIGLAFVHLQGPEARHRQTRIVNHYAEGITERNGPFPLVMILIIAGVVIWGFLYTLMHGLLGVKI